MLNRLTRHSLVLITAAMGLNTLSVPALGQTKDPIAKLQTDAVNTRQSDWGYWGPDPETYSSWKTHSNRLIPVYTFGMNLDSVKGKNSLYRDPAAIEKLFGYLPERTHNPKAKYFDQTDVYRLQKSAAESGKKRVILVVFDGMDWHITRSAAIAKLGQVAYDKGRGKGLHFLDYRGADTDFGFCVTTPHNDGTSVSVDKQIVSNPGGKVRGGYDPELGGHAPWGTITDVDYLTGKSETLRHAYTDSASSATSLTSGIKTYNAAINVDHMGREALPIARTLQDQGYSIGVVTSVPISHATPASAYSNNVHRNDYQDLTRDLIGRPSIFHPGGLAGVDVLIGGGWGVETKKDGAQGKNFVPGNKYLTDEDLQAIDVKNGGKYVVAQRTSGVDGQTVLTQAVEEAKSKDQRLFGYFGVGGGHLPFRTADGNFDPVVSFGNPIPAKAEVYSEADLQENVELKDMAVAALDVLNSRSDKWWLMVEAGDVDWANHSNNIDNSIGAVHSGDDAFDAIVSWIEHNGGWDDTALILTADHGHYFNLHRPEALIQTAEVVASP
ncbi:Alkaline phosphatase 4 precursor [Rubripirellula lacrimiformis]|uniref:Alkaline phosphatase 4 n=1 Tax=Rubripirellula lacrimiformis TaxID=1930273 RepID=A0A517NC35_9BACT|nr:alkaline phosphatase [Rubripirellula lacrimiformis]QDT04705.1 Alkaline phosphatase 4 precursor [Rubripirellula lacrimiformis]